MKHILSLVVLSLIAVVSSCSRSDASDIVLAETAVDRGDYATAKGICDELYVSGESSMGVSDLLRLSIVYMKLGDIDDAGENTASAIGCYARASKLNPDSVAAFAVKLPASDLRYFKIVSSLDELTGRVQSLEDFEYVEEEYVDDFASEGDDAETATDN